MSADTEIVTISSKNGDKAAAAWICRRSDLWEVAVVVGALLPCWRVFARSASLSSRERAAWAA
jgi:hypothetical protein